MIAFIESVKVTNIRMTAAEVTPHPRAYTSYMPDSTHNWNLVYRSGFSLTERSKPLLTQSKQNS
jgi:hypothetical protein